MAKQKEQFEKVQLSLEAMTAKYDFDFKSVKASINKLENEGMTSYADAHKALVSRCDMLKNAFESLDQEVSVLTAFIFSRLNIL